MPHQLIWICCLFDSLSAPESEHREAMDETEVERLREAQIEPGEAALLARQAQALSDATRVNILVLLRARHSLCVSDLVEILDRGQSKACRCLWVIANADERHAF